MTSRDYTGFYSEEAERYDKRRYEGRYGRVFRELHHEAMSELVGTPESGKRLLEVACGTGHVTELFAGMDFEVTATDLTASMLDIARERCRDLNVTFMEADARALPFEDGEFDVVVATRFLHLFNHVGQVEILDEMRRVVRPGGRIVIDFDNRTSHRMLAAPLFLYNVLRYRRTKPDTNYNSAKDVRNLFAACDITLDSMVGVGGYHLLLPALFSHDAAVSIGRAHRKPQFRFLAEQLAAVGIRR